MKRALAVTVLAPWFASCTLVTDPWGYSEVSLESELERVQSGCAACMRAQCLDSYERCAGDAACVGYASCRLSEASPPGRYTCANGELPPEAYEQLMSCKGCQEACGIGAHFQCAGRYSWPRVEGPVQWTQRIVEDSTVGGNQPFAGFTVRACFAPGLRCGPAISEEPNSKLEDDLIAWTKTDESGSFSLDLPAGPEGFEGIFVVSGPGAPVYRIHYTYPLRSAVTEQKLFSEDSLMRVLATLGASYREVIPSLALFQTFDCLHTPARGVSLEFISGGGLVAYLSGPLGEDVNFSSTTAEGAGAGAIFGVEAPQGYLSLAFVRDEKAIQKAAFGIVEGEISVFQTMPGASSEVEPW